MSLKDALKRDEGCVLHVYKDSLGILTAGYGHNLEAHCEKVGYPPPAVGTPVSQELADDWLEQDMAVARAAVAQHIPWSAKLDPVRCDVLCNMAFNMGIHSLLGFHRALTMGEAGNYEGSAAAFMESKWARQVGKRAERLAEQWRTGIEV